MLTKASILALCAAASINGATAAAHHRHQHAKKLLVYPETEIIVVTEYVTKTIFEGEEPTPTPEPEPISVPPVSVPAEGAKAFSSSKPQEPTTTPIVVVPTTTESPPPPPPAPTTPTTLATLVRTSSPAADTVVPSPAQVEVQEAPSSVEEPTTSTPAAAPVEVPTTAAPEVPAVVAPVEVQTTSAPTTTAAPTTASTQSSSGGKRGAAYNDPVMLKALLEKTDAISWVYNWGNEPWDLEVDIPFIPTMWGEKVASDWTVKAQAAIDKGAEALFSFNEPDNAGQANMVPTYAAAKHQEWMNPFAGKAKIGAPSISSSQEKNQGIDWLTQFFTACADQCQVDFCNAHWYGPGGEAGAEEFLTHLKNVRDVDGCAGKPLYVTEFMPQGSDADNETFMKNIIQSLESSDFDFVEKYSYFMVAVGDTYLMSSTTEPNALGKIYANLS